MSTARRLRRYRPLIIGGAIVVGALEVLALQRTRRQRRHAAQAPKALPRAA